MKIVKSTGSTVVITGTFTDSMTGELADPIALQFKLRLPDATTETFTYGVDDEIVRTSTGKYRYSLPLLLEGTYRWKWIASAVDSAVVVVGSLDSFSESDF